MTRKIVYTDLTLTPDQLLPRKHMSGPIPDGWVRHQFEVDYSAYLNHGVRELDRWLSDNIEGRWASYSFPASVGLQIVINFERIEDAVMFKLRDGEQEFQKRA